MPVAWAASDVRIYLANHLTSHTQFAESSSVIACKLSSPEMRHATLTVHAHCRGGHISSAVKLDGSSGTATQLPSTMQRQKVQLWQKLWMVMAASSVSCKLAKFQQWQGVSRVPCHRGIHEQAGCRIMCRSLILALTSILQAANDNQQEREQMLLQH